MGQASDNNYEFKATGIVQTFPDTSTFNVCMHPWHRDEEEEGSKSWLHLARESLIKLATLLIYRP